MYILFIFITIIAVISFFIFTAFSSPSTKVVIGQKAPDFELYDQDGNLFSLDEYIGKKLVIYFFPKAFTPGWTKQACEFRDKSDIYIKNNIHIVGISYDTRKTQKEFSEKYSLKFKVLSDSEKKVSNLYGIDTFLFPKRVTFLIDENGIIFDIVNSINLSDYADKVIEIFKENENINENKNKK